MGSGELTDDVINFGGQTCDRTDKLLFVDMAAFSHRTSAHLCPLLTIGQKCGVAQLVAAGWIGIGRCDACRDNGCAPFPLSQQPR